MEQWVMDVLTNFAFPVVMCLAMGYYVKHVTDRQSEERVKLQEQHSQEVHELSKTVENNTAALIKLYEKLDNMAEVK